jgi:hypothetical protein
MNKIFNLLAILVFPILLNAQQHSFELNSNIVLFNSALSAQTILNSLGYIDDEQKLEILNSMDDNNSAYIDLNNEMRFNHKKGWSIAFGNHTTIFAEYDKNMVKLGLYGNTSTLGESFDLLPLKGLAYHYSDITFEYQFSEKLTSHLSLIAGHQFVSGEFSKLNYESGPSGTYLSYDMSLEGIESGDWRSYINNRSELFNLKGLDQLFKTKGRGFSVGFDYEGVINEGAYKLSVSDLGFIYWDDNTRRYDITLEDKLVPLQVNDFSEVEADYFLNEIDTLRDVINPYNQSYRFSLPTRLSGSYHSPISNQFFNSYTVSFDHRLGLYEMARIAFDLHKKLDKHEFVLGYHYGGLERNGLQFAYHYYAKGLQFNLFSRQLNVIDNSNMYGFHLGLGLKFMFGSNDDKEKSDKD